MRDILLSLVIAYLLLKSLHKGEFGAYTWAWLSLMNPHKMSFGFAASMPFAQLSALVSLVALLFPKSRKPLPMNGGVVALLLLWVWMTITSIASINDPDAVWERWIFVSKINLMLFVTIMLIRGREQTERLIWVVVVSIGYFGFKGGVFTVLTGGSYRVWGPPDSMMEENNALAVALIIVLPLMYYLRSVSAHKWVRHGLAVAMVFIGASILGSQSRGALVALLAMSFVLGAKSKHPVRFSLILMLLIAVGIAFMPESWSNRMGTIQNYEGEGSALSRIYTWRTLWNLALDHPFVGSGFRADNLAIFGRYAPTGAEFDAFQGKVWVAHSIYMQALGEHGFIGLALYLWMWGWVWFASGRLAKKAAQMPALADWVPLLLRMCQVSAIGFCAGGAFLSLMNVDLPYYIMVFVTMCKCAVDDQARQGAPAPGTLPLPGQPQRADLPAPAGQA